MWQAGGLSEMQSNLVGQYVVCHYDDQKQEIVAVFLDRGIVKLMTKNPDGRLTLWDAEGAVVSD